MELPKLKKLFDKRSNTHRELTDQILEMIDHVVEGAKQFIISHDGSQGELTWEDVSLFGEGDDSFILMVGIVNYKPGDVVNLPVGSTTTVTKDTVDYFRRLVKIGVPMSIISEGDVEAVIKFLTESTAFEDFKEEGIDQTSVSDFDLNELTDDQRKALDLFNGTGGEG